MKIAVIGSRTLEITESTLKEYLPPQATAIVSGGAKGIDTCAARYAENNGLELIEIRPQYEKYGRTAPIVRNKLIVESADAVIIFWDEKSKGTKNVIDTCKKTGKEFFLITL
ncbi:MAG: DUF2493 domain-containing protein [Ruminococcaceae bacterium]|nr:DUF2493 domain-containing protein [Oscillospiraceae bacterium]